ncbi:MAG: NADH:flavin oxidoreductase/NADH oxidase [Bifidobacteriaceae bacterium]|jgi:2,4-dienoyl-CoA reductase-like NADH-dependent reductase (Old Yellow Enzyme family)|nr:NADH:flavin oxidoreductase/NADH oxidase [Bifidobacteriaceae bacterium]
MAKLFTPIQIGPITAKNRLWVSPMCQYSATGQAGRAEAWHLVHYGALAAGGAGLVMVEATGVVPHGRITPWDLGLWDDAQIPGLAAVADFIKAQGAVPAIQLGHAGGKASTNKLWLGGGYVPPEEGGFAADAASAIAFPGLPVPHELTEAEVGGVVQAFADAARRAHDAGFEAIEVHAAHGFLLHQFLSPLSNSRSDRFGGSLENRCRLVLEVLAAVRCAIGESVALVLRVSATDWVDPGWDLEQTTQLAAWAQQVGLDHLDVSSGGVVADAKIPVGPAYQAPFAAKIAQATGLSVNSVGVIDTAPLAESLVAEGGLDTVMLGRPLLRDPHTPIVWATELGEDPAAWSPPQYSMAAWRRYHPAIR